MKNFAIIIGDLFATVIMLAIVLKVTAMMGFWSHGYNIHFESANNQTTTVKESYVRILDEEIITNVEYILWE